ncbi:MAG: bifunctional riboflavin kinase/FAD synthetase, partial [Betaproteobacteria bacterium]|nr:bifunctional riboflavin kinase/FAD synthetase [Betaproteobacteria bacterium]
VRVHGLPGGPHHGVASVGVRPTVKSDNKPLLEVFLLDFDQAIYGRRITVEFLSKLRDEERYADLDTLARKIGDDVNNAREYFAAHA